MSEPYRDNLAALRLLSQRLRHEAADIDRGLARACAQQARREEIRHELASVEARLLRATKLDPLDSVRIASPCDASWDEMCGDQRVRLCHSCNKNVYNIAGMPRAEALALLARGGDPSLCLRIFRRADGTVLTADCPDGVGKKRVRRLAMLAAGGALASMAAMAWRGSTAVSVSQQEGQGHGQQHDVFNASSVATDRAIMGGLGSLVDVRERPPSASGGPPIASSSASGAERAQEQRPRGGTEQTADEQRR